MQHAAELFISSALRSNDVGRDIDVGGYLEVGVSGESGESRESGKVSKSAKDGEGEGVGSLVLGSGGGDEDGECFINCISCI